MIIWKSSREAIKVLFNSANGLRLYKLVELLQLQNYMKKFIVKSENHQNLLKKLSKKILAEIKKNSKKLDLMQQREDKMLKRESKSDLKNSRNKRNDR